MLSQHAMHKQAIPACSWPIRGQEVRHAIPACSSLESYPSMQSASQKSGELDTLSQHALETNHRSGKLDMLSQHTLQNLTCIKEAVKAQNSGQADTAK